MRAAASVKPIAACSAPRSPSRQMTAAAATASSPASAATTSAAPNTVSAAGGLAVLKRDSATATAARARANIDSRRAQMAERAMGSATIRRRKDLPPDSR